MKCHCTELEELEKALAAEKAAHKEAEQERDGEAESAEAQAERARRAEARVAELEAGINALADEMRGLSSRGAPLVSRSWVIHRCEQILAPLPPALKS